MENEKYTSVFSCPRNNTLPELLKSSNFDIRLGAVKMLLSTLGEDVDREGLQDTPKRVAKMYTEIFKGYTQDPIAVLGTVFKEEDHQELVLVRDIPFFSHCEHHMVPFHGIVHVAYIPNGTIVGLSKIARLVEVFARRLQVQERLTSQIADTIQQVLNPLGVAVVINAQHMCMTMRGVQKPGSSTTTSALRGVFRNDGRAREEFYALLKL